MVGYGTQAVAILALYALFFLWSVATWLLVRKCRIASGWEYVFATGSFAAGPILAGSLLTVLFWTLPALEWEVYLGILFILPSLASLALLRKNTLPDISQLGRKIATYDNAPFSAVIGAALFLIPLLLLAFQLSILPLHGNDPLEYMQLGRAFHEHRDARIYPILTALPEGGFVAPWTHPPTYGVLISIAFALQGSTAIAGAAKLIGLWFALSTSLLVAALIYAADKRDSWRVWLAPFFVLTLPLYYELVQNGHIDALRLTTFTLAIGLTCHFIIQGTLSAAIFAGLGVSLAMLSHSIGILAPAIAIPLIIVCWTKGIRQLLAGIVVLTVVALAIAGPHYIRNVAIFGNPIQDNLPIWDIASLRVTEFLRVTRGLETILDRLYVGIVRVVMTPSTSGYVVPIGILMIPALIWTRFGRGKLKTGFASLFNARGDSLAIQLSIAIGGFATLIIGSAVAGTDLAVKNARYILTILPLAIGATMIGIGQLVDDTAFQRSVERLWNLILRQIDRIRSWGPKRFQPPVRTEVAIESGKGLRPVMLKYGGLAVAFVAVLVVYAHLMSSLRITTGFVRIYFDSGFANFARMLESEHMKRDGSLLDDSLVDIDLKKSVSGNERILTFRQASLGFYTTRNFRFHADHKLLDLFKTRSASELHKKLLAKNVHWIQTPNFPLPEINNSAFAELIADHRLLRPITRSNGWALYRLRALEAGTEASMIAKGLPFASPNSPVYATTDSGSGMVDGRRARLTVDPKDGSAELFRQRGLIKDMSRWDAMVKRPVVARSSPTDLNSSDFLVDNDPIKLRARISGRGLAEIVVEYLSFPPALASRALGGTTDLQTYRPTLSREVVWSGVLNSEPTEVAGWLTPVISPSSPADVIGMRRGARVIFRLADGERLRVHEWQAEAYRFAEATGEADNLTKAVQNGWAFSPATLHSMRGIQYRAPAAEISASPSWPFAPVGAERLSTIPAVIGLPPVYLPIPEGNEPGIGSGMSKLERLQTNGSLRVVFKVGIKGFGQVVPALSVVCATPRPGQSDDLANWSSGGTAATGEKTLTRLSTPLQLWDDKVEQVTWQENLPCVPRSVRLLLQNASQSLITLEERLLNVERQRTGYLDVHTFEASLVGGNSPENRLVVPLHIRPVVPDIPGAGSSAK